MEGRGEEERRGEGRGEEERGGEVSDEYWNMEWG